MTSTTKNIHIVASDLDGTLLSPDHKLSAYTTDTLKAIHQQGFTFVFATGRHHIDVGGIREMTGIPAYMITSNGARVHTPENELMFSRNVPEALVPEIVRLFDDNKDIFIHIYRHDEWLLSHEDQKLKNYHNESGFMFRNFDTSHPPADGVAKLFFTHVNSSHEVLAAYEEKLNERFAGQVTVSFSSPWCLEVMGPDISKGHALDIIAQSLNQSLDNCVAFGDGMNDVEMLTMAGTGLVMETAHEKVMAALPEIPRIGSNADDAVARYLEMNLLSASVRTA